MGGLILGVTIHTGRWAQLIITFKHRGSRKVSEMNGTDPFPKTILSGRRDYPPMGGILLADYDIHEPPFPGLWAWHGPTLPTKPRGAGSSFALVRRRNCEDSTVRGKRTRARSAQARGVWGDAPPGNL